MWRLLMISPAVAHITLLGDNTMGTKNFQQIANLLDRVALAIAGVGKLASWLLVVIIAAVLLSIGGGLFRMTRFASWENEIFLFGTGLSLNSIQELQWHLFGVLLMLTGAYALERNRHVRVDVISARFSARTSNVIEILGDLIFLLPFCILMLDRSLPLVEMAWKTAERSNEDGLTARWLIKSFVPFGFALLILLGVTRVVRNLFTLMGLATPVSITEVKHDR